MKTEQYQEKQNSIYIEHAQYGKSNFAGDIGYIFPFSDEAKNALLGEKLFLLPFNSTGSHWILVIIALTESSEEHKNKFECIFVNSANNKVKLRDGSIIFNNIGEDEVFISEKWAMMKELDVDTFDFYHVDCKFTFMLNNYVDDWVFCNL